MRKTQLIDAVTERVGDKKTATVAVETILDTIADTVAKGEKVTLTGFGSWERAYRPAREARNPATGEAITVPATFAAKFKVGADFKTAVAQGAAHAEKETR